MTTITYGPWVPDCDPTERGKMLRSLATIVHLQLGAYDDLVADLRAAESGDPAALEKAFAGIEALPSLYRRRVLASFSAVSFAQPPRRQRAKAGAA